MICRYTLAAIPRNPYHHTKKIQVTSMPLEYYLRENGMTSDPDDYMAVSMTPQSFTIDDVYEHMTREGSTITRA